MANKVELRSIGSLLTGDNHFYIPSYQRGYRWRRKQAEELLSDLYSFTKNPEGDFYCLQPVIVKPILPGDTRRKAALGNLADDPEQNLWELVDGQQRLTSIFILLKVMEVVMQSNIESGYEFTLYSLHYESRPDFLKDIESVSFRTHFLPDGLSLPAATNIDAAHANSVFRIMAEWFDGRGKRLSRLYKGGNGEKRMVIAQDLLKLLTADTDKNVVNVIWYQLDPNGKTDTVKEFININNGKIPLLDSELVKALFLQRRKNEPGSGEGLKTQRAFEWEMMENRLQANDFWGFISPDDNKSEDRMGTLLEMIYLAENYTVKEIEKGDVFRYFYDSFEGKHGEELSNMLSEKWEEIVDAFHAMEDWYESPLLYNHIGYLIGSGDTTLSMIYKAYKDSLKIDELPDDTLPADGTTDDTPADVRPAKEIKSFREWLDGRIRESLKNVEVKVETGGDSLVKKTINLPYNNKNRKLLRNVFKLLNIHLLTEQFEGIVNKSDDFINDAGVFRFPFHLYKEQEWDIEHIDSQTTNPLTSTKDKIHWVVGALLDVLPSLSSDEQNRLKSNLTLVDKDSEGEADWEMIRDKVGKDLYDEIARGHWDNAIHMIEAGEDTDVENVHDIGNLTLLDSETNRTYKNALFCTKRKYVVNALSKGRYILPATQCVFMKFFDSDTLSVTSRIKWQSSDKEKHHDFIYNNLKKFLPDAQ